MATAETRKQVLARIREQWQADPELVIVVSAMGRRPLPYATDTLLQLVDPRYISGREQDLLMSMGEILAAVTLSAELNREGIAAEALTGAECGIITDDQFGDARILRIDTDRIRTVWRRAMVPVVAGFQGTNARHEVTTLGRGGSDTTAVAIAAALKCPADIYTDVPGIFTADPRVVPEAQILSRVEYHEVLEMAQAGARVIHPRAVESAGRANIAVRVLSTFDDSEGTTILPQSAVAGQAMAAVTGIAHQERLTAIHATSASPLRLARLLDDIGQAGITIDMINLFAHDLHFVIEDKHRSRLDPVLAQSNIEAEVADNLTKVTVVGAAISQWPGVMSRITGALFAAGISIRSTSDSQHTISLLVDGADGDNTVKLLHRLFDLGESVRTGARHG